MPHDEFGQIVRRLVRTMHVLDGHDYGGVRVTVSEAMALGELNADQPLTQLELGDRLGLEKSTISRLVGAMESRSWLVRERDPRNRRFAMINLTEAGSDVAERVARHVAGMHAQLLGALTEDERRGLIAGLSGIARAIDHTSDRPDER